MSLIEAIHLSHTGHRVLVVDGADRCGGAWATTELGPFRRVELGPHLIKPRDGLYELIDTLGVDMQVMTPQPKKVMTDKILSLRLVPPGWHWLDSFSTEYARARWWRKPPLVAKSLLSTIRQLTRKAPRIEEVRYPRGGSQAMVDRLQEVATNLGVEIRLGVEVKAVRGASDPPRVRVELNRGVVDSSELVFTSGVRLNDVSVDGRRIEFTDRLQHHSELLLLLRGESSPRFSFLKMPDNDKLLHMVSDVTPYAVVDGNSDLANLRVISVRLRSGWAQNEETIETVLAGLRELGLVRHAALVRHQWITVSIPHRRNERVKQLTTECAPCLRGLYTYDLGMALLAQRERWLPTLEWLRCTNVAPRKAA